MDKLVVKEFIQQEMNADNLKHELKDLLENNIRRQQIKTDYFNLKKLLSAGGNASANAAEKIYGFLVNS